MTKFKLWQQSECFRLGVTTEQHNQILKVAGVLDTQMGMGGGAYDGIIKATKLSFLEGFLASLSETMTPKPKND